MKLRDLTLILVLIVCMSFLFTGWNCGNSKVEASTEKKQQAETEQILAEIDRQVGLPNLANYQQKKTMKMIYELCDQEDLVCYAYLFSDYRGELNYVGRCIGFGVPFSAQYTNPDKIIEDPWRYQSGGKVIPQADPNGLYMPTSSTATWLMMLDEKTGNARPVYFEPTIVVSPFPLH